MAQLERKLTAHIAWRRYAIAITSPPHMQVLSYTDGLATVIDKLRLNDLVEVLAAIINGTTNVALTPAQKERFSSIIFAMSHGVVSLRSDPETAALIDSLPFVRLLNPSALAQLMTRFQSATNIVEVQNGLERIAFWQLYWGAKSIIDTVAQLRAFVVVPKLSGTRENETVLQLEVIDYDGLGIQWERLEEIIQSLGRLYSSISRHLGEEESLRLAYADSGSDLGLGIIGKTLGIEAVRSLFRDGWKQIRFWREVGFDRRVDSLSKGLGFLADVRLRVADGQIAPEDAARLERAIVVEMTELIGGGVALREVDSYTPIPRKDLISGARDMRLIGGGQERPSSDNPPS